MNKFLKRIKLLNNNWTNNSHFAIKSFKEIERKPVQLKAFIKYNFETEIKKEKRFGAEPPSCHSKCECQNKIQSYQDDFLNNNDQEFLQLIPKQAKEREPNLKDKWTSIKREETYIEDCHTCHAEGQVTCTNCTGITGTPTGKVSCGSCFGNGKKNCFGCGGSGRSGDKTCFSCGGSGKSSCSWCLGTGKTTCSSCSGNLKVTCHDCEGHKQFTFSETIYLNVISNTELNWDLKTTPEWMTHYLNRELSDNTTHIELMKYSNWHSHTFNLGSFEKGQFFASIQGNIEPFEVIYTDNNGNDFNCRYVHKNLIPYEMDYIFDDYINKVCDNVIEKNAIKYQKEFFKNKIIENIVDEKGNSIPSKSKMISLNTKQKIKKTFKDFSDEHLEEQKNIDLRDIFSWTSISFLSIFMIMFLISVFSQNTIDWNYISLPNMAKNIPNTFNAFTYYVKYTSLNSLYFLIGTGLGAFGLQKLLGSSKKSIFRYLGWFTNVSIISFLLFFNLFSHFNEITWLFNTENIGESFSSVFSITFDILLFSLLIGILKARNINCFKMRNIAELLNNETLKSKLGY